MKPLIFILIWVLLSIFIPLSIQEHYTTLSPDFINQENKLRLWVGVPLMLGCLLIIFYFLLGENSDFPHQNDEEDDD